MKSYKKTIVHMIEYTETIKKTIDFYNKHHKEPEPPSNSKGATE